jgi:hypothetical protein
MGMTMNLEPWKTRFAALHEAAVAQTGLSDFGDTAYHEGLNALLAALDDNPPSGPGKVATANKLIVDALVSRLHTQAQWAANPAYASRVISAPVIVIGLPRTGTTALHNLLSCDPQFQGIEKWLTDAPIVRPARHEWANHPQYQACVATVAQMTSLAPEVMQAHGVTADEVDECLIPMAQDFTSNFFPSQLDVPAYDRWLTEADETPAFRRYRDMLKLVGLNDDRRWLLKNPSHVFGIEAMLSVFPDACIVQTHRHPAASLASLVNLLANILLAYTGEEIDRSARLVRETAFWAEAVRRTMAVQDRYPGRIVNVLQKDIRSDPLAVVRTIYRHFDLTLSADAEQAMGRWAQANAEKTGSGHSYATINDQADILAAFGPYIDRYKL